MSLPITTRPPRTGCIARTGEVPTTEAERRTLYDTASRKIAKKFFLRSLAIQKAKDEMPDATWIERKDRIDHLHAERVHRSVIRNTSVIEVHPEQEFIETAQGLVMSAPGAQEVHLSLIREVGFTSDLACFTNYLPFVTKLQQQVVSAASPDWESFFRMQTLVCATEPIFGHKKVLEEDSLRQKIQDIQGTIAQVISSCSSGECPALAGAEAPLTSFLWAVSNPDTRAVLGQPCGTRTELRFFHENGEPTTDSQLINALADGLLGSMLTMVEVRENGLANFSERLASFARESKAKPFYTETFKQSLEKALSSLTDYQEQLRVSFRNLEVATDKAKRFWQDNFACLQQNPRLAEEALSAWVQLEKAQAALFASYRDNIVELQGDILPFADQLAIALAVCEKKAARQLEELEELEWQHEACADAEEQKVLKKRIEDLRHAPSTLEPLEPLFDEAVKFIQNLHTGALTTYSFESCFHNHFLDVGALAKPFFIRGVQAFHDAENKRVEARQQALLEELAYEDETADRKKQAKADKKRRAKAAKRQKRLAGLYLENLTKYQECQNKIEEHRQRASTPVTTGFEALSTMSDKDFDKYLTSFQLSESGPQSEVDDLSDAMSAMTLTSPSEGEINYTKELSALAAEIESHIPQSKEPPEDIQSLATMFLSGGDTDANKNFLETSWHKAKGQKKGYKLNVQYVDAFRLAWLRRLAPSRKAAE